MNRAQLSHLYDSYPESQRDMPKAEFVKKAMDCQNPAKNKAILSSMIERKCQIRRGQMEKAVIDSAITRGK